MPSLHVGWALWCAAVVLLCTSRRWVRVLAVAYPVATTVVVVATANHYLLDAVAGAVVIGAGALLARATAAAATAAAATMDGWPTGSASCAAATSAGHRWPRP